MTEQDILFKVQFDKLIQPTLDRLGKLESQCSSCVTEHTKLGGPKSPDNYESVYPEWPNNHPSITVFSD